MLLAKTLRFPLIQCGLVLCLAASLLFASSSPAGAVAGYGDIDRGKYYTEPVQWSVDNDITGIDGACFDPDAPVSRGETAVWIWNMENQPSGFSHAFTDITDSSQEEAIAWMAENGITTGTSDTTFSPGNTLTRGQLAAFLHRMAGEPTAVEAHQFTDVVASWQQGPVSWLTQTGITKGTSPNTFSPDNTLTRAQLITFLYRFKEEPDVTVDPNTPTCQPTPPTNRVTFAAISAGDEHTCGIRADGTAQCWGRNNHGQTKAPEGVFTAISAGSQHSCGIKTNGIAQCWGRNNHGQTSAPIGTFTAISAGGAHSCGIKIYGIAQCWGKNFFWWTSDFDGVFTDISAGGAHSCGIKDDIGIIYGIARIFYGTAQCWGWNEVSGVTDVPDGVFTDISAGGAHSCGIRTDGTAQCWGNSLLDFLKWLDPPRGVFTAISAGGQHSCGIRTDGTAQCWGNNNYGQTNAPDGLFSDISAGGDHSCGIRTDGTAQCWGNNNYGQTNA